MSMEVTIGKFKFHFGPKVEKLISLSKAMDGNTAELTDAEEAQLEKVLDNVNGDIDAAITQLSDLSLHEAKNSKGLTWADITLQNYVTSNEDVKQALEHSGVLMLDLRKISKNLQKVDISIVKDISNLKVLKIIGAELAVNVKSAFENLKIEELFVDNSGGEVGEAIPLLKNLTNLTVKFCGDTNFIHKLTHLKKLSITLAGYVSDVSDFWGMKAIEEIKLSTIGARHKKIDFLPLTELMSLKTLDLSNHEFSKTDFDILRRCTHLKNLIVPLHIDTDILNMIKKVMPGCEIITPGEPS